MKKEDINKKIKKHDEDLIAVHEHLEQSTFKTSTNALYQNAINDVLIPINSLSLVQKAFFEGTIKIAFWGDSITAGADQVNKYDCYVYKIEKELKKIYGDNVKIEVRNYGLGSRTLSNAIDENYKTFDNIDIWGNSYWNNSKSWRDNIKDFSPNLLVVAFGMNDVVDATNSDYIEFDNLTKLNNWLNTWDNKPNLILVPTILPTTNTNYYTQRQDITQSIARVTREFCKDNGFILADVNRLFKIIRDGVDDVARQGNRINLGSGYQNFIGDVTYFTSNGNDIIGNGNNKGIVYNRNFYNGVVSTKILNKNDNDMSFIEYRYSDLGKFMVTVQSGANALLNLYADGECLQSVSINYLTNTLCDVRIEVEGIYHNIYFNNELKISLKSYRNLHDGKIRIGGLGVLPNFGGLNVVFNDELSNKPLYNELDIFGEYNNSVTSGNGINHPTGLGYSLFYMPCFTPILKEFNKYNKTLIKIRDITSIELSDLGNTTESIMCKYVNLTVSENYQNAKNKGVILKRKSDNKIFKFRKDLIVNNSYVGNYVNLKEDEFFYLTPNSTTDQIIINSKTYGDFELYIYI